MLVNKQIGAAAAVRRISRRVVAAVVLLPALAAAGRILRRNRPSQPGPQPSDGVRAHRDKTLTVITHDSFALADATIAAFKTSSGYDVQFVAPGDAGTVVNQLILTKDAPLGDVVFGIDNTFAGRALNAGVLSPYAASTLPADAAKLAADDKSSLTPIDYGDVCLNADTAWFKAKSLAVPETLDDLLSRVQGPVGGLEPGLVVSGTGFRGHGRREW